MYEVDNEVVTLPLNPDEYRVDPDPPRVRVRVEETEDPTTAAREAVAKMMQRDPGHGMPGISYDQAHVRTYCDDCDTQIWTAMTAADLCASCRVERAARMARLRDASMTTVLSDELTRH